MRKVALVLILALVALSAQDVVIRGGIALVDVLVTVRDKKGGLVTGLDTPAFRVSEDGVLQEIRAVSRQSEAPLTIGMLIDISGSVATRVIGEKAAAIQFFDGVLRPQDQAFVISFARKVTLWQETTSSVDTLRKAINDLEADRLVHYPRVALAQFPRGGRGGGAGRGGGRPGGIGGRGGFAFGGTLLWDAVFLAADEVLAPATGRKAIVLITDGADQGSRYNLLRALEAAQRSDVIVYTILLDGSPLLGIGGSIDTDAVKRLSDQTGGRTFEWKKKLDPIFRQINDELRSQYSLSYVSTNDRHDGLFRKIDVKMVDKNHNVQARTGYYAPKQ
jgi:VWFA-related protein